MEQNSNGISLHHAYDYDYEYGCLRDESRLTFQSSNDYDYDYGFEYDYDYPIREGILCFPQQVEFEIWRMLTDLIATEEWEMIEYRKRDY